MRNARLLFAALVVLTVVLAGSPATAETTHDTTALAVAPTSPAPAPAVQPAALQPSWLAATTRSAQPAECYESYYDGTCWFFHDLCSGWCTLSCPWGDSQGPC